MSDLTNLIGQALHGDTLSQLSSRIGASEQQTQTAAMAALPVILGAMKRNASTPEGAQSLSNALENDHDGSILDQLGGFLSGHLQNERAANGDGILGHILGGQRETVQQGVSRASGLDLNQVAKLLPLLAPIVMAALGKKRREQAPQEGGGLADLLAGATSSAREQAPSGALDILTGFLDSDGDGDVKDDLLKQAGSSLLGKLFRR
ncbi:MAG: DUF937 domain-containing protein [Rubricoccaceae bacterium]|nr:DUF937 domain-containing protein [Rubricoccaceae bacterium]